MSSLKSGNVVSVNFTQSGKIAEARHRGMIGAWLGASNPFVKDGELWKAFNEGRRAVCECAPLGLKLEDGRIDWNPVDFSRNHQSSQDLKDLKD